MKLFNRADPKERRASKRNLRALCWGESLEQRLVFAAPPLPTIPSGTFLITSYGATTASANNATQIQAAINAASAAGGGTVEIPAGTWMSGPITLATKIRFQVDSGATLKAVAMASYPNNTAPSNFIVTSSKNNIEVVGPGTIDGNGQDWWTAYIANNTISRPRIFNMTGSDTVYIHNIRVQNSPQFNIAISTTNNVTIDGVTIYNPTSNTSNISPNTDGIDIGGSHWLIQNCNIDTGDDNIVVKPGSTASSDMTITNCFFGHGHGLSIGGQTNLGLNGLYCSNITFDGTTAGIRMKASRIAGGLVQNCFYDNMTMYNVQYPINLHSYYLDGSVPNAANTQEAPQAITSLTPYWQNISISNITSTWDSSRASYYSGAFNGSYCGIVWGLPEAPIKNVQFTNIHMTSGKYGFVMNHVRNVHFDRATSITPNPSTNQDFISNKNSTTVLPYDAVYWTDADINSPTNAGNAIYDVPTGNTTVTGGGADYGTTATDQFNFTSTSLTGDAHFYAKVVSQSSTNATAKAGVMIRNSSANNAAFATVVVTPTSGVQFRWRASDGGTLGSTTVAGQVAPLFVRLSRSGSSFTAYYSSNGTTWTQIGSAQTVTMTNTSVLAGLAVTSANNSSAINSAVFSNVELLQWLVSPAASPSPVTGTTSSLSVIATNSLGDNLRNYAWSATTLPSGASAPTFSPNNTTLTGYSTATFTRAGVYVLQMAVSDANGLSLIKTLALTVNQTATSASLTPSSATVGNATVTAFTATMKDQFGNALAAQPTFTWSVDSGGIGSVNANGQYTSPSTGFGSAVVRATSGSISASAAVTVNLTRIDGTSAADVIRLVRNGANVDFYVNSATPTWSYPFASLGSLTISTLAGNDVVTLDASAGACIPSTGLSVAGGNDNDTLSLIGSSAADAIATDSTGTSDTRITFNGAVLLENAIETNAIDARFGRDTLSINAGPGVLFSNTQELAGLTLQASTFAQLAEGVNMVLDTNTFTIASTAKLDLCDNAMIIRTAGALASVASRIISAQNGVDANSFVNWSGFGITSSTARSQNLALSMNLFAVGAIRNGDLNDLGGAGNAYTTFKGRSVGAEDVLLRFTYNGDSDLSGSITINDYVSIDSTYGGTRANRGWVSGDSDYDGTITIADYVMMDTGYAFQSGPLSPA